jgi:hypothetical protein
MAPRMAASRTSPATTLGTRLATATSTRPIHPYPRLGSGQSLGSVRLCTQGVRAFAHGPRAGTCWLLPSMRLGTEASDRRLKRPAPPFDVKRASPSSGVGRTLWTTTGRPLARDRLPPRACTHPKAAARGRYRIDRAALPCPRPRVCGGSTRTLHHARPPRCPRVRTSRADCLPRRNPRQRCPPGLFLAERKGSTRPASPLQSQIHHPVPPRFPRTTAVRAGLVPRNGVTVAMEGPRIPADRLLARGYP